MGSKKTLSGLLLCLIFCFSSSGFCGDLEGPYSVTRVVDGDTIVISYNGTKEKVRMLCVDTPESVHPDKSRNSPQGKKASQYTFHRLNGENVYLEFEGRHRGKYGRLLAYVWIGDQNYNIELVREGWSPYYIKYGRSGSYDPYFRAAESEAKRLHKNIWGDQ